MAVRSLDLAMQTCHGLNCLYCPLPECVLDGAPEKIYHKRGLAVDQAKLRELRDKPRCVVPACPEKAIRYAWNDGERVLDGYCNDHRAYADSNYYEGRDDLL